MVAQQGAVTRLVPKTPLRLSGPGPGAGLSDALLKRFTGSRSVGPRLDLAQHPEFLIKYRRTALQPSAGSISLFMPGGHTPY
jgi:hypothetical protein